MAMQGPFVAMHYSLGFPEVNKQRFINVELILQEMSFDFCKWERSTYHLTLHQPALQGFVFW